MIGVGELERFHAIHIVASSMRACPRVGIVGAEGAVYSGAIPNDPGTAAGSTRLIAPNFRGVGVSKTRNLSGGGIRSYHPVAVEGVVVNGVGRRRIAEYGPLALAEIAIVGVAKIPGVGLDGRGSAAAATTGVIVVEKLDEPDVVV